MFRSRIIFNGFLELIKRNSLFNAQEISRNLSILCATPVSKVKPVNDFPLLSELNFQCLFSSTVKSNSAASDELNSTTWEDTINIDINAVTGGDPALEKKLKILFLEREILKQEGCKVPSYVKEEQWKELLQMTSRNKRKDYFKFLFSIEMKKENRKRKKEERMVEKVDREIEESSSEGDRLTYGFRGSTIFLRVYDTTINNLYNSNAIRAMIFGQKLVFDCSYDPHMNARESKNCAKQLMLAFAENRIHPQPFNLYFTSARPEIPTMKFLHKHIPTLYDDTFPVNITDKSYLELFPKKDLVYLTPHCREELVEYNHDDVYIVGAMVDKVNIEPLSLAKAKKEGLRMAKLPLDRYLDWGSGSGKRLTLNQILNILLDQQMYGDWKRSLRHVPQRKLIRDRPVKQSNFRRKGFVISNLYD